MWKLYYLIVSFICWVSRSQELCRGTLSLHISPQKPHLANYIASNWEAMQEAVSSYSHSVWRLLCCGGNGRGNKENVMRLCLSHTVKGSMKCMTKFGLFTAVVLRHVKHKMFWENLVTTLERPNIRQSWKGKSSWKEKSSWRKSWRKSNNQI